MNTRLTTHDEATTRLIIEPLAASGEFATTEEIHAAYDVDAIADECIEWKIDTNEQGQELLHTAGYAYTDRYAMDEDGDQDTEAFWSLVERHAR